MLLAAHPGTSAQVLEQVAHCGSPTAVAAARLRLDWEHPFSELDADHFGPDDVEYLTGGIQMTAGQRASLFRFVSPTVLATHLSGLGATAADLDLFYDITCGTEGAERAVALPVTHPNTAAGTVVEILNDILPEYTPNLATVLVALDNHNLTSDHLTMAHVARSVDERDRLDRAYGHLRAVQRPGGLVERMRTAPLVTSRPDKVIAWADVLSRTANPDLVDLFLDRWFSDPRSTPDGDRDRVLWCLLGNPYLTVSTCTRIAERVLDPARRLKPQTLMKTIAFVARHGIVGPALDQAVRRGYLHDLPVLLLAHPHLTSEHLDRLADVLRELPDHTLELEVAALIALHPHCTNATRARALQGIPANPPYGLRREQTLIHAAHGVPLAAREVPEGVMCQALAPTVRAVLDAHCELLTNPDIARAVLTLAPTFPGTFAELIDTAAVVTA